MLKNVNMPLHSRNWVAFILLFFLIFIIYSNTFQASWHFDDYPNIVDNSCLHLKDLNPQSLLIAAGLHRPIPNLTFAVNWYFSKSNVTGYHVVNIIIHFMTAFILFLTILNLFKSPNLNNKYQGSEYFIALLTAAFWAINPIQTQAVTYIVQRMASISAMFYILGIYFYLKGRVNKSRFNQAFFFLCCLICYLLALGSKENGVTLPVALLLIEFIFFQNLILSKSRIFF